MTGGSILNTAICLILNLMFVAGSPFPVIRRRLPRVLAEHLCKIRHVVIPDLGRNHRNRHIRMLKEPARIAHFLLNDIHYVFSDK